jgi:hypothetical protein
MKRVKFLTGIAVVLVFVASCGQPNNKSGKTDVQDQAANELNVTPKMDQQIFANMLKECCYKLPVSVMPKYLKTEEQRRQMIEEHLEDIEITNRLSYIEFDDNGGYETWVMNGYLTDDEQNIVLNVMYGAGLDWFTTKLDKMLNYNIETEQFTEIELPLNESYTADELIGEIIDNKGVNITDKAKKYFNLKHKVRFDFSKNGLEVRADLWDFWDENDYDFWENNQQQPSLTYTWNGKEFVKSSE